MDDSISILAPNKVAVHIADPTSFIPLGSDLDYNASLRWESPSPLTGRSVTYYYPDRVYPLYPWEIATACSLSTTQFADTNPGALASLASPQTTAITPPPSPHCHHRHYRHRKEQRWNLIT